MTPEDAFNYINSFLVFGSKPGLERISNLLEQLGHPERELKFVHVAGTNGKGSCCEYLSGIFRAAGYKTGLFVSPYVLDFRERFRINGEMIPPDEMAYYCDIIKTAVDGIDESLMPTEFEIITALGYLYFAANHCDVVVLEVGLGGKYDSTNTIDPLCSVIMSISLDHTHILGDTIAKIAAQKAGIIKQNRPCVMYPKQTDAAQKVIADTAQSCRSRLIVPSAQEVYVSDESLAGCRVKYCSSDRRQLEFTLKIAGECQPYNAVTAIEAALCSGLVLTDEAIACGVASASAPARCELISREPFVLIDGAHNPDGVRSLHDLLTRYCCAKPTAIIGMMADKDIDSVLKNLLGCFSSAICITVEGNPRAISGAELAEKCRKYLPETECADSFEQAFERALAKKCGTVVCGSFYLAEYARRSIIEALKK